MNFGLNNVSVTRAAHAALMSSDKTAVSFKVNNDLYEGVQLSLTTVVSGDHPVNQRALLFRPKISLDPAVYRLVVADNTYDFEWFSLSENDVWHPVFVSVLATDTFGPSTTYVNIPKALSLMGLHLRSSAIRCYYPIDAIQAGAQDDLAFSKTESLVLLQLWEKGEEGSFVTEIISESISPATAVAGFKLLLKKGLIQLRVVKEVVPHIGESTRTVTKKLYSLTALGLLKVLQVRSDNSSHRT